MLCDWDPSFPGSNRAARRVAATSKASGNDEGLDDVMDVEKGRGAGSLFDPGNDGSQSQSMGPLALSFPAAYAEYVRLLTGLDDVMDVEKGRGAGSGQSRD
jgi:hypothetical protein